MEEFVAIIETQKIAEFKEVVNNYNKICKLVVAEPEITTLTKKRMIAEIPNFVKLVRRLNDQGAVCYYDEEHAIWTSSLIHATLYEPDEAKFADDDDKVSYICHPTQAEKIEKAAQSSKNFCLIRLVIQRPIKDFANCALYFNLYPKLSELCLVYRSASLQN